MGTPVSTFGETNTAASHRPGLKMVNAGNQRTGGRETGSRVSVDGGDRRLYGQDRRVPGVGAGTGSGPGSGPGDGASTPGTAVGRRPGAPARTGGRHGHDLGRRHHGPPPAESAGTLYERLTHREYDHMLADLPATPPPRRGGNARSPDAPNAVGSLPDQRRGPAGRSHNQTADALVDTAVKAVAAGKAAGKFASRARPRRRRPPPRPPARRSSSLRRPGGVTGGRSRRPSRPIPRLHHQGSRARPQLQRIVAGDVKG
jgi:hypothetical protein